MAIQHRHFRKTADSLIHQSRPGSGRSRGDSQWLVEDAFFRRDADDHQLQVAAGAFEGVLLGEQDRDRVALVDRDGLAADGRFAIAIETVVDFLHILVAVRAMVPVTQKPPNRAEPMLAAPWATSSQLER